MNRVFCKHCKFHSCEGSYFCLRVHSSTYYRNINPFTGEYTTDLMHWPKEEIDFEPNKNGECEFYKPKWWLFWKRRKA